MTYGSLFTGIGGLDRGVEAAFADAGIPLSCAWQVEIDPFCREVLAKHWLGVNRFEDVRLVGSTGAALAPADLVVGGFPCTDVSVAGKRAGLGAERSGLWFEYLRIIREVRPRAVIIENVPGLIRRGLDAVVAGLAAENYAVEATRIEVADVGGTQLRQRVLVLAYAARLFGDGRSVHAVSRPTRARKISKSRNDNGDCRRGPDWKDDFARMVRVADGAPRWLDEHRWPSLPGSPTAKERSRLQSEPGPNHSARLKALGNAVVPQCAYVAARRVIERAFVPARGEG